MVFGLFGGGGSKTPPIVKSQAQLRSEELMTQGLEDISAIRAPGFEDLVYELSQLVEADILSPEEAQQYLQSQTELAGVQPDEALRGEQLDVLRYLDEIEAGGGFTAQERAQVEDILGRTRTEGRGAQEAILQSLSRRGAGGGGMEAAARMVGQQGAIDRASRESVDVAAEAERRRLEAALQRANLAGGIEQRDVTRDTATAQAQDAINRFNQQMLLGTRQQQATDRQRIAEANVARQDQTKAIAGTAAQQAFQNQLTRGQALSGQATGQQQVWDAQASRQQELDTLEKQRKAQQQQATMSTLASIGMMAAMFSDERMKEDVHEPDIDAFLESLHPMGFKYVGDDASQVGISAQELEEGPAEGAVIEIEGMKAVDTPQLTGALAAAVKDLDERIKNLEGMN